MKLDILYEDNHLLVVNKSAGVVTQGAADDQPSLIEAAKADLKRRFQKPGNVFLGVVSRLDSRVTGVVVLARTSKAADRLTQQFRGRTVEKLYWGIVAGAPPPTATMIDWLWHDDRAQRVVVVDSPRPGAQEARSTLQRRMRLPRGWVVALHLETGRKHQLRVQLASRGWPLWGDEKYGSREPFTSGIALHARQLSLDHPTRGERLTFTAPLPLAWRRAGVDEQTLSADSDAR